MWPGHFRTPTLAGTDGAGVLADQCLLFWQFRGEIKEDQAVRDKVLALLGAGIGASNLSASVDARPPGRVRDVGDWRDTGDRRSRGA